jgi:hypothetical protein
MIAQLFATGDSGALGAAFLAWSPFLQPAPGVNSWWWLLVIPTALGISFAYKSARTKDVAQLPREALWMSLQIVAVMIGIAIFLHVLVVFLLPVLPVE